MLQLHLSDQQFYCLLRCVLYQRLYGSLTLLVTETSIFKESIHLLKHKKWSKIDTEYICWIFLTHWSLTKWRPLCQCQFQMNIYNEMIIMTQFNDKYIHVVVPSWGYSENFLTEPYPWLRRLRTKIIPMENWSKLYPCQKVMSPKSLHLGEIGHIWPKSCYVVWKKWSSWVKMTKIHDDVIKWKHFPRYWPFVQGILRWPVNSPHKRPVTQSFDFFLWSAPE